MLYGLYLSATGVVTSSYKQDVVANNLANSESVGFKRDVPSFQERLTEAAARRQPGASNPLLEKLGGGLFASPTAVDPRQGELEPDRQRARTSRSRAAASSPCRTAASRA
jgi:flagellar basal body rod protein FlgG